jgi:hypothetical protein
LNIYIHSFPLFADLGQNKDNISQTKGHHVLRSDNVTVIGRPMYYHSRMTLTNNHLSPLPGIIGYYNLIDLRYAYVFHFILFETFISLKEQSRGVYLGFISAILVVAVGDMQVFSSIKLSKPRGMDIN